MVDERSTAERKMAYWIKQPGGTEVRCKKAAPNSKGWLHYELMDGTVGLAKPGSWRRG